MNLSKEQLHGLAKPIAERYGKPHWQAHYRSPKPTKGSVDRYVLDDDAVCIVCGKHATNAHHEPPKGIMRLFPLVTERGLYVLRPALLAVCGSGTTGCHGAIHAGRIKVTWEWDHEGFEDAWWSGSLLESGEVHASGLYSTGCWVIRDASGKELKRVRQ